MYNIIQIFFNWLWMLCHREVRRLPHSPDRDVTSACASLDKKKRTATAGAKLVSGAKIDTDVYTYFSGHRRARASEALAEALHFLHAFDEKVVSPTSAPRQPHVTTTSAPRQPHVSSTSAPRQPTSAPRQPPTHPPTPLTPTPTPLSHTSS